VGKQLLDNDVVNHPKHYTQGPIECLEAIESMLGEDFEAYLRGAIVKYVWRSTLKNGREDYLKAQFYLNKLIEVTR
jgi:hypothetical protein